MQSEISCLSERDILHLARQGDPVALERLYLLHSGRVYALCLRMVKNPTQAEDLTQETFLAVLRGIRAFRGQSNFTTWLYRVTRNTVLMCFRKKRLKETSLEEINDHQEERGHPRREWGNPDHHLESIPDRLLLQSAVASLSGGFRAALVLHDIHGYQHREIAAILGCATGTSKSQVHKARLRVRKMLKRFAPGDTRQDRSDNSFGEEPAPSHRSRKDGPAKNSASKSSPRRRESTIPSWSDSIEDETRGPDRADH
jgi:RNA polymerase sigma-70 factor (ECF subfamily)